jgi:diguanylate cyclase (GGDEF)-like protein
VKFLVELEDLGSGQRSSRILVVEDNPVERQLLCRILRNYDFDVIAVDCGNVVLDAVLNTPPDIILLDALLPDTDGFDVCVQLRGRPETESIPVIMLTGLDDVDSINRSYEVGATDFFPKPINHTLLFHRIRYLLRARLINDALRLSQNSLASAQSMAQLGSWELETNRARVKVSPQLQDMLGIAADSFESALMGTPKSPIVQRCHPDDRNTLITAVQALLQQGQESCFECRFILPSGAEAVMDVHLGLNAAMPGAENLMQGVMMDVTARKASELEIVRVAYFDRLTTLPGRSLMELYLDYQIPQSHMQGKAVGLLSLDLDLFNRINNSMGHAAGNEVLVQLSQRLASLVVSFDSQCMLEELTLSSRILHSHRGDLIGRMAADCFVVILPGVSPGDGRAEYLAQRIKNLFNQPFLYRGQELFVTGSIGIAHSESGGVSAEQLLQQADLALHEAKVQGRNEICQYSGELVAQIASHLSIQSDLKKALSNNELELYYQPKVSAVDAGITGFEALIRWNHPQKGMVPPYEFIRVAEDTGQIVEIGEWVLETACRQNKAWVDQGLVDVRVAVNVSSRQLKNKNFVEVVEHVIARTGISPDRLELEITENMLMSNLNAVEMLNQLRGLGISIALDDFGTGYSSLSYLPRFPLDVIKVDRSFVQNIHCEANKAAIVSGITTICKNLQFSVVAEGVETEEELQVVRQLNCDHIQGYLYCKPMPVVELDEWLVSYNLGLGELGSVS